jgi:hypothetical protein
METPKIETTLDNQIKFVDIMLEYTKTPLLYAIKESLIELKNKKEKEEEEKKDVTL